MVSSFVMNNLFFLVGIVLVTVSTIPSYSAPIESTTNIQTRSLFQDVNKKFDSESLGVKVLGRVLNDIVPVITSRLVRDPDPTTLETARKFIDKAKAFIEPVAKSVSPDNKDSSDVMDVIGKALSSLKELIGSDDVAVDQQAQHAMDVLMMNAMKVLKTA